MSEAEAAELPRRGTDRPGMTADAAEPSASGRRCPARLSTNTIVAAALEIVDTVGETQFSMRLLGVALDVRAMSIYRYFGSRRALLAAVVDAIGSSTSADLDAQLSPADDWRSYLRKLAHHQRLTALTHPDLFMLIASHPTASPWLRPPIRTMTEVDTFVQRLTAGGFSAAATVSAYKRFTAFLLGHLMCEVVAHDAAVGPGEPGDHTQRRVRPRPAAAGDHPNATALADLLSADTGGVDFEQGLFQVLDELDDLRGH